VADAQLVGLPPGFDPLAEVYLDDLSPERIAAETYTSVGDCPLDDVDPSTFGDDSLLGPAARAVAGAEAGKMVNEPAVARKIVRLLRALKRGMKGNDALAVKRALAAAGYRAHLVLGGRFRFVFGRWAAFQLRRFQRAHGLQADGVYGARTHAKLARYFDAYGAWLMEHAPHPDPLSDDAIRRRIVANALFTYNCRGRMAYTQGSHRMDPIRHRLHRPHVPTPGDCSSTVTWDYWEAGARDPNGNGYNGLGFTGTLASHGRWTTHTRPGDLDLYGWAPFHHVTINVGGGKQVSFGSVTYDHLAR
jgi:hypothetical protein